MASVYDYLSAIGWQWWVGIGVLESALVIGERLFEWKVPRWLYGAILIVLVPFAGFHAWYEQRDLTESWRAKLEGSVQEIGRLEGERKQLQEQVDRLRAAPEQRELQALRDQVATLTAKQASRELTPDQRTKLVAMLRGADRATIVMRIGMGGGEPARYADQLAAAFREAGWHVDGAMAPTTAVGLVLKIGPHQTSEEVALVQFLLNAFDGAGIERPTIQRGQASGVTLYVGEKP